MMVLAEEFYVINEISSTRCRCADFGSLANFRHFSQKSNLPV